MFKSSSVNKTNRNLHKWLGIIPAIIFLMVSITGILLIFSKQLALSPKMQKGVQADLNTAIPVEQVIKTSMDLKNENLKTLKDIKRVEFHPLNRVYKVRTKSGFEVQIDMSTGKVLKAEKSISSTILSLHTGAFFGTWFKEYIVGGSSVALIIVTITGVYLFVNPIVRRKRRNN